MLQTNLRLIKQCCFCIITFYDSPSYNMDNLKIFWWCVYFHFQSHSYLWWPQLCQRQGRPQLWSADLQMWPPSIRHMLRHAGEDWISFIYFWCIIHQQTHWGLDKMFTFSKTKLLHVCIISGFFHIFIRIWMCCIGFHCKWINSLINIIMIMESDWCWLCNKQWSTSVMSLDVKLTYIDHSIYKMRP